MDDFFLKHTACVFYKRGILLVPDTVSLLLLSRRASACPVQQRYQRKVRNILDKCHQIFLVTGSSKRVSKRNSEQRLQMFV